MADLESSTAVRRSSNFEYLRVHDRRLSNLGAQADRHVCADPNASMVKSRQFVERLAQLLWERFRTNAGPGQLHQRIGALRTSNVIDDRVHGLLTDVRLVGNKATHEYADSRVDALRLVQTCYELGKWFHLTITATPEPPPYVPPAPSEMGYINRDDDPRGAYKLTDLKSPLSRPNLTFPLRDYTLPPGKSWRYSRERLLTFEGEGRIFWSRTGTPFLKRYYADHYEINQS